MQWVCYVEVQGLYAAVARTAGLAPAGKPVVVLREGRVCDGCREAFSGGLVLGAPARQALRDAPHAIQVDLADIDSAGAARAWWDRCLAHTPYLEPGEPHQLFLSLPAPGDELTPAVRAEVTELLDEAARHGFVAFAGIGTSKLVARAAALHCREGWLLRRPGAAGPTVTPQTMAFVPPGEEARYLAPLPVAYLPAPPDVQRRLVRLGMRSIGEAARIPEAEWVRQLGPLGRQMALWSRGADPEPVKPCYPPRSLKRRVEFAQEVRDRDHLEQVAGRSAATLAKKLAAKGKGAQQVTVILERPDGPLIQTGRTLAKLQQAAYPLRQAVQTLLGQALEQITAGGQGSAPDADAAGQGSAPDAGAAGQDSPGAAAGWDGGPPVSALTVELSLVGPMPWQQLNLWDDSGRSERDERLQRALQLLHERFSPRLVGLGPRTDQSWREQMLQFADPYRWSDSTP